MSIRYALLALLSRGQATTYQLRKEFELSTEGAWSLNIGQVSTTLDRLARDGFVVRAEEEVEAGRSGPGHSKEPWRLTVAGRADLDQWWASPVPRLTTERNELVIKLALATTVPGVDVAALVQTQRAHSLSSLHDLTRVERGLAETDLVARLAVRHHVFVVEAELRWLDDVEGLLARTASDPRTLAAAAASAPDDSPLGAETGGAAVKGVRR